MTKYSTNTATGHVACAELSGPNYRDSTENEINGLKLDMAKGEKISDFKRSLDPLVYRDEQALNQIQLKIDAINALTTIAEVEAFDVSQPIV